MPFRTAPRALVVGAATIAAGALLAVTPPAAGQEPIRVGAPAERVGMVTGPGPDNFTDVLWQVKGTDLGIVWSTGNGQHLLAFGDTFGVGWSPPGTHNLLALLGVDWRSNTLARSSDPNLADGLHLDNFAADLPLRAKEILPSKKVDHDEVTVIPTAGVNVNGRNYLAYMSVRHWEPGGGRWSTNFAGIAYSDDNGQTWIDVPHARRPNTPAFDDPFQMLSYARRDGFVYMFGTPNGRFGDASLARVPEQAILDPAAYTYWTGGGWVPDPAGAVPVIPGPVGELSVHFSEDLGQWLMMYLDESRHEIVLRTAPSITGPWGEEQPVASAAAFPELYAPYIHPASRGHEIYFTMSEFRRYNVSLMRVRLTGG